MGHAYYIASCVFTSRFPELSRTIQAYVSAHYGLTAVRCCVKNYKLKEFAEKMPIGCVRDAWTALPDSAEFEPGDRVYSLCHNCNNIIEETHPGVEAVSLWELLAQDAEFPFPDYSGLRATVQDCWRSRNREGEQRAVREILDKMRIRWVEAEKNHQETDYCGPSLYRAQPPRNPKLAPRYYVDGAKGLFLPHTPEEQKRLMEQHCSKYQTATVICYCHYCLEGLQIGGMDGRHLAELLFCDYKISFGV